MNTKMYDRWVSFKEFGCWFQVTIENGEPVLFTAAMLSNGGIDLLDGEINHGEVTDFYQDTTKSINRVFGTNFNTNCEESY